jgi:hypothetical protein
VQPDEQPIRDLVRTRMEASAAGDLDRLNADDLEVQASGKVTTPAGEELKRLSGQSLSVLRKQAGRWVIARDANFVTPERQLHAAVPVLRVASVAR